MLKLRHVRVALAALAGAVLLSATGCGGSDKPYVPDIRHFGTADWTLEWADDSPSTVTVAAGQSASLPAFHIQLRTLNGEPGVVTLSSSFTGSAPANTTLTWSSTTATPVVSGALVSLTPATGGATVAGDYPIVITATDGNIVRHLNGVIRVTGFIVTIAPANSTVVFNTAKTDVVTVTPVNHFRGTVALAVSGVNPLMFTTNLTPASVVITDDTAKTSDLLLVPNGDVGFGTPYTIRITGTCNGASAFGEAHVTVVAD